MLEYETRQEELRLLKEAKELKNYEKQRRLEEQMAERRRRVGKYKITRAKAIFISK